MPINVSCCTIDALTIVLEQNIEMSEGSESATGNVHLLVADISNLLADPALQTEALQHLSSYRREKVEACGNPRNRALSIGVALLLDCLLSEHGLHECEMTYVEGEHGKPSFAHHPELLFNLSHSGSLVAAAMLRNASATTYQIGVDLQRVTRYRPDIVRRMFSAADRALLAMATDEAERERLFAQCWCRAEAYAKATGTGLQWPFPEPPAGAVLKDFCLGDKDNTSESQPTGSTYCGCLCLLQGSN